MSFFYHEEPPNPTKICKFLKDAFANCHTCRGGLSSSNTEEEDSAASDIDDEQEVVVSEIRSRAMKAKSRRKASFTMDSFSWVFSPTIGELFITPKVMQQNEDSDHEEREDFFSVGSRFSRCSSARSMEAFVSVKTNFSRCSSLSGLDRRDFPPFLDCQDLRRRSIVHEFCHCEGWPFGLCRKAMLLPPLPKSPSESWSWRSKGARLPLRK